MKRIERNTYNSIKRNTTADTINVEIPVEYSHEARQAIHEYLTINGMRVTGINWNSIQECYCIHWEPARTETAEAIRRQQENADIDDVIKGMEYSDLTWNGYRKPAEAPTTAPTDDPAQQPTTTDEAPQAATEAPEGTTTYVQNEEEHTMKEYKIKPEFYDLWGAYEGNDTVTAEQITDLAREWETTVSDLMDQVEEQTTETTATTAEAATAAGIIHRKGGYRERDLLNHPHEMIHGETWNEAHKVVEILATTPDPDGYRAGCAVDIVTRSIVG